MRLGTSTGIALAVRRTVAADEAPASIKDLMPVLAEFSTNYGIDTQETTSVYTWDARRGAGQLVGQANKPTIDTISSGSGAGSTIVRHVKGGSIENFLGDAALKATHIDLDDAVTFGLVIRPDPANLGQIVRIENTTGGAFNFAILETQSNRSVNGTFRTALANSAVANTSPNNVMPAAFDTVVSLILSINFTTGVRKIYVDGVQVQTSTTFTPGASEVYSDNTPSTFKVGGGNSEATCDFLEFFYTAHEIAPAEVDEVFAEQRAEYNF